MPRVFESAVVSVVARVLGADLTRTPAWLLRPTATECGDLWPCVRSIYGALTGLDLPEVMPPRETRRVDAVLTVGGAQRILEVDETQHFNQFRASTLRRYPDDALVAFPIERWIEVSEQKTRLEGGGFGRPRPPLFPNEHGRHMQRAFRDTLADLLPAQHGYLPTLRIGYFDAAPWIGTDDAEPRMRALLNARL